MMTRQVKQPQREIRAETREFAVQLVFGGAVILLVPLHGDFDRLTVPWLQRGQVGSIDQDSDTPGHPRAP